MRRIDYIVECEEYDYPPQVALLELKRSLVSEGIEFDGIFYECVSQKGYVWTDDTPQNMIA